MGRADGGWCGVCVGGRLLGRGGCCCVAPASVTGKSSCTQPQCIRWNQAVRERLISIHNNVNTSGGTLLTLFIYDLFHIEANTDGVITDAVPDVPEQDQTLLFRLWEEISTLDWGQIFSIRTYLYDRVGSWETVFIDVYGTLYIPWSAYLMWQDLENRLLKKIYFQETRSA